MPDDKGLVDETVAVPSRFMIVRFWQGNCLADEVSKGVRLWKCLPVELVYPSLRTVCGDNDQGDILTSIMKGQEKRKKNHHSNLTTSNKIG